jgi:Ca2+-binding EF-hand superfamily protein
MFVTQCGKISTIYVCFLFPAGKANEIVAKPYGIGRVFNFPVFSVFSDDDRGLSWWLSHSVPDPSPKGPHMKPVSYGILTMALAASAAAQPPQEDTRPRPDGPSPEARSERPGSRPGMLMPPGPGGFPSRFPNPLLMALDRNRDGELSEEEIDGSVSALKTLDRNRDRRLDASELRPNLEGMGFPGTPGRPPGDSPFGNIETMLQRLMSQDRDDDGKLSREEIPEGMRPNLAQSDRNGDGLLDSDELRGALRSRMPQGNPDPAQFAAQMFRRGDANQDGKLTGDEIPPFLRERVETLDTNGDGGLDQQEIQAGMNAMRRGPMPEPGTIRPRRPEGGDRPGREGRPGRPEAETDGDARARERDGDRGESRDQRGDGEGRRDRPEGDGEDRSDRSEAEREERRDADRPAEKKDAEEKPAEEKPEGDQPESPAAG